MADAAAEIEAGGLTRTLKDLFAGAAGGIAQVLLGEFKTSLSYSFLTPRHSIQLLLLRSRATIFADLSFHSFIAIS